jgi:Spy/CpxP family protein refolding chaperone
MKSKLLSFALLASMVCGTAMLSQAQGPGGWGGGRGGDFGHMATLLNLTSAQKEQIHTLMQAQRTATAPLHQQLAQIHIQMLNATANGAFNQATIQALATQEAQIMSQLTVQRESMRSQIYNTVLTAQQKTTAEQLRQNEITQINEHLQKQSGAASQAPAE